MSDNESLKAEITVLRHFLATAISGRLPYATGGVNAWTGSAMSAAVTELAGGSDPEPFLAAFAKLSEDIRREVANHNATGGA